MTDAIDRSRRYDPSLVQGQRLLVINPNTNPVVTALIRDGAALFRSQAIDIVVESPPRGPLSIETQADREIAEAESLTLIGTRAVEGYGAIVLGCFDDIALEAGRRIASMPIISASEAGIAAAGATGLRFAVVTTVESAVPAIEVLLDRYGASGAPVRAAGIGVAAAAAGERWATERLEATIRRAIQADKAEAILLGSGGLTGRAEAFATIFGVPVIDAVLAAIETALGMIHPS